MEKLELKAASRQVRGKHNTKLRAEGQVPAVVYGHGVDPAAITLDRATLERVYAHAGGNRMVGLKLDEGRSRNILIHEVQKDSRNGHILHADFYVVKMNEK